MKFKKETIINNNKVIIYSYHDFIDAKNIDIFVKYMGNVYSGVIYRGDYINEYLSNNSHEAYFYDPYGIYVENITEEAVVYAVHEIIMKDNIKNIFCKSIL